MKILIYYKIESHRSIFYYYYFSLILIYIAENLFVATPLSITPIRLKMIPH